MVKALVFDASIFSGSNPLAPAIIYLIWGCSSAGRAPALQAGGQGFENLQFHHMPYYSNW